MEFILYLLIGLIVGAVAGYFIGAGLSKAQGSKTFEADFAAANARAEVLQAQVNQLEAARLEREAKDARENRLLQELAPVREQLGQMREAVTKMEADRIENLTELRDAIKANLESDELLRKQTQVLSTALSSNSVRGVWGEAQLRRLVELAGLLKHADFDEQATITTGRADMIINLPGGKQLAIDSKVPYNSYQEASQISELSEGSEKARRDALIKDHVKAVRKHIDDLATREYWNALNASPDFVVAFIPSESLLAASLEADPSILEYAFAKNVALASPVSLFSVLKTINYIWRQNVDESQVRQMLRLGKELYERVEVIADKADKLGRSILGSVKDYNAFISSFESRFLVTARKLNNLDENELATSTIDEPKAIEETPKEWTSSEAIDSVNKPEEH
ncbi:MAG: DNA recombination protein RmuC [Micrococcales bacterium]